jgi:hypothetical protein
LHLEAFLLPLIVAPFDETAARAYDGVHAALEKLGTLDTLMLHMRSVCKPGSSRITRGRFRA